ncbi:MAG: hypothetical protein A2Z34_04315 [Planctomycetes bacterium RBG_16_59_8]|nr:MAG: hypothetical protein A2Z34_04315 [Planctomycetes bacterium RBG_16_59_8]
MQYSKKDLKSVDALALILVGMGVVFLFVALPQFLSEGTKASPAPTRKMTAWSDAGIADNDLPLKASKKVYRPVPGLAPALLGFVFVCLGVALNLGVRRVVRNKGKDVEDYAGVPETLPGENG